MRDFAEALAPVGQSQTLPRKSLSTLSQPRVRCAVPEQLCRFFLLLRQGTPAELTLLRESAACLFY
jgi:hypothetical protein